MTIAMIKTLIVSTALSAGVDPQLALSVASVESNFRHDAVSHTGDYGIFQLNRRYFPTAPTMSVEENIRTGVHHLKYSIQHCDVTGTPYVIRFRHLQRVNCQNIGVSGAKKLKRPWEFPYFRKVVNEYNRLKKENRKKETL